MFKSCCFFNKIIAQFFVTFCAKMFGQGRLSFLLDTYFSTVQTDPVQHFEPFKGKKKHESVKTAQFKFCCFGGSRRSRCCDSMRQSSSCYAVNREEFTNLLRSSYLINSSDHRWFFMGTKYWHLRKKTFVTNVDTLWNKWLNVRQGAFKMVTLWVGYCWWLI